MAGSETGSGQKIQQPAETCLGQKYSPSPTLLGRFLALSNLYHHCTSLTINKDVFAYKVCNIYFQYWCTDYRACTQVGAGSPFFTSINNIMAALILQQILSSHHTIFISLLAYDDCTAQRLQTQNAEKHESERC